MDKRIYIIGAGFAGQTIADDIKRKKIFGKVNAFIDDNKDTQRMRPSSTFSGSFAPYSRKNSRRVCGMRVHSFPGEIGESAVRQLTVLLRVSDICVDPEYQHSDNYRDQNHHQKTQSLHGAVGTPFQGADVPRDGTRSFPDKVSDKDLLCHAAFRYRNTDRMPVPVVDVKKRSIFRIGIYRSFFSSSMPEAE